MVDQGITFAVLGVMLVLLIRGPWRYDIVALGGLLFLTMAGIIPGAEAFLGFGSPAVVTVAAVLVVSRGLRNSGLVDWIAKWLSSSHGKPVLQVAAMTGLVTVCSGFMNNVGALALLMPVALRIARESKMPPSALLMPMAFGSLLGGLTTLIGTPPNIIISEFRARELGEPFGMFQFSPVGVGVALCGVVFVTLIGWRLLPKRRGQRSPEELFQVGEYITELRLKEDSPLAGISLRQLGTVTEAEVTVLALIRNDRRELVPSPFTILRAGDVLTIGSHSEDLKTFIQEGGVELAGSKDAGVGEASSEEFGLAEAVVMPSSLCIGLTAQALNLRQRYGINLLAVARKGARLMERLSRIHLRAGDVLLLQGNETRVQEAESALGWLPLAERNLRLGEPRRIVFAVGLFASAVVCTALGWLPVSVAFVTAAVAMRLAGFLSLREIYESIDWPVIVLLGALMPVGEALERTGGAQTLADLVLRMGTQVPPSISLGVLLVGALCLSNVINNAAAAVLMAPIAFNVAMGLGLSADPFLIAVAVGCSCAFMTPIGHQSNTLVMEPAGYKFGDYARMGLPLSILVVAVAVPLILFFWPF